MIFMDLFSGPRGGLSAHPAGAAVALNRGGSICVMAIARCRLAENNDRKIAGKHGISWLLSVAVSPSAQEQLKMLRVRTNYAFMRLHIFLRLQ
jgi:hypothetical protein